MPNSNPEIKPQIQDVSACRNLIIYGAGGQGRVVLDTANLLKRQISAVWDDAEMNTMLGHRVCSPIETQNTDLLSQLRQEAALHIAVGHNQIRERLQSSYQDLIEIQTIVHPTSQLSPHASIGAGTYVGASAIIQVASKIGAGCIINTAAIVEHDCNISSYCHLAPRSVIGGGVSIGQGTLLGIGATVLPGLSIGAGCVIGAGAVVTHDLKDGQRVAGIPAREIPTANR